MKEKISSMKKGIATFKKMWKNPRIRGIIVLGLYFFFFLFIIMSLRSNHTKNNSIPENLDGFEFSLSSIQKGNYHYIYEVEYNTLKTYYEGNRYQQKEMFVKNDSGKIESFYNYDEKYLKNINQVWSKTENPYLFPEFKDIHNIESLLKEGYLDSKTEYSNESKAYTYKISTNNIVKIIDKRNIDIADIPNTIIVTTNSNQEVGKIEMDLSSYSYYKDYKSERIKIIITYSKFGEIELIEDPE